MDIKARARQWIIEQLGDKARPEIIDKFLNYHNGCIWNTDAWLLGVSLFIILTKKKPEVDNEIEEFILSQIKLINKNYPILTRDTEMRGSCGWGAVDLTQRSF